jgi:hypothetical protein
MDSNQMLYSSGISVGMYAVYKFLQNMYHKYYLTSECHQRTLEISVIEREEKKEEKEQQIELEIVKK